MNAFNHCESNPKEMWRKISDLANKETKTTNITEIAEGGIYFSDLIEMRTSLTIF